jgi:cytoskeletal protein RodZ
MEHHIMKYQHICTRVLVILLAFSICGTAEFAQALQTASPAQSTTTAPQTNPQDQQTPAVQNPPSTPADLPNAPSDTTAPAKQSTTPSTPTTVIFPGGEQAAPSQNQSQSGTPTQQQPLGTAAAEKGVTRGGAASRPAGTAIAGTKQRQSRSFLIKLGAVAAAGVALGTVYALTKGTGSAPPGAAR